MICRNYGGEFLKLSDIAALLEAEIIVDCNSREFDICSACGADLMSDVMAYSRDNAMLLTGLVNPQVIRTADMMDIRVVVFVRGKHPTEAIMELAAEKGITVLKTCHPMFVACGKLYSSGVAGKGP